MIIDNVEIATPEYISSKGEYSAMVRFEYHSGMDGAAGQINLICRTASDESEILKVIKERLIKHAIYQLKWMPEFQQGDESLTVVDAVDGIKPIHERHKHELRLAYA
ncbi:MAG: hypothetical protein P8Q99_12360 [Paracoccaceae bacterium]|nr:hypothetical protein [Paracoccaceae bacterium]